MENLKPEDFNNLFVERLSTGDSEEKPAESGIDFIRSRFAEINKIQAEKLKKIASEPRCFCDKKDKRLKERIFFTTVFRCPLCKKVTSIRKYSIKKL